MVHLSTYPGKIGPPANVVNPSPPLAEADSTNGLAEPPSAIPPFPPLALFELSLLPLTRPPLPPEASPPDTAIPPFPPFAFFELPLFESVVM